MSINGSWSMVDQVLGYSFLPINKCLKKLIILCVSFFCMPKRRNKKRAACLCRPFGLPCASHCCCSVKKLGFASDRCNVFSQQQLRCSASQDGLLKKWISCEKPSHAAEQRRGARFCGPSDRLSFFWLVSLDKQRNEHRFKIYIPCELLLFFCLSC